jgi:hypothetical protein
MEAMWKEMDQAVTVSKVLLHTEENLEKPVS